MNEDSERPCRMLLARHAATDLNLVRPFILQGQKMDPELSELGRRQAAALARAVQPFEPAAVYSSPLRRAVQTATAIEPARPIQTIAAITECDIGAWEGMTWEAVDRKWPDLYRQFIAEPGDTPYLDGESFAMVRDRARPALETLAARHAGQTIVVVCHNIVNRAVLADWLGLPQRAARPLPQENGAYNLIEFFAGKIKVRTIAAAQHLIGLEGPP